jgi:CBS domain-containing protein
MNGSNPRLPPSESTAIAFAIGSVALGMMVVWLAKYAVDSLEGSVLIALVLLPLVVYLISSGKLAEFKAPGGIEIKFVEAAKEPVTSVSETISYEDLEIVAKASVTDLLKSKAGEIDQSRPVVMTVTIAGNGHYTIHDLKQYLDVLSQFRNFKFVVFLDRDKRFVACMQAWALKQLVTLPNVADEFIGLVNAGNQVGVLRYPGVVKKTISPASTNFDALREMQDHNIESLIVVDEQKMLRGVVERYQVLSRLMLSLVR